MIGPVHEITPSGQLTGVFTLTASFTADWAEPSLPLSTSVWAGSAASTSETPARYQRQPFAAQPYEQLASVYRHAGQDTEARRVAIARRSDLRKYGNLSPPRRIGNWLLDKSIKYGYQTWRAVAGLISLYVIVLALSIFAQHHGLIVPVGNLTNLHPTPVPTRCVGNYPCFYPAGYAIDTVIPIINVHQAAYWGPSGHTLVGMDLGTNHLDRDRARMGTGNTARRRLHGTRATRMNKIRPGQRSHSSAPCDCAQPLSGRSEHSPGRTAMRRFRRAGRLHLEPTADLLAADIAKVPLITAR